MYNVFVNTKEVNKMTAQEQKILKTFEQAFQHMTPLEKEKLLLFGEGMAFMAEKQFKQDKPA